MLSELNAFRRSASASTRAPAPEAEDAGTVLPYMGFVPVDLDSLCVRAGLPVEQVSAELLRLELAGRVAALPGGRYQRLS